MDTKKIGVIFGGCSPEYGVSLQSAYAVIRHMDKSRYAPVLIGISSDGRWFRFEGSVEKLPVGTWLNDSDCAPCALSPDRSVGALLTFRGGGVEETRLDAVFPVLHGKNGEDGTVQGVVELAGIPLICCGVLASALCMDKDRAHRLVRAAGIRTPESLVLTSESDLRRAGGVIRSMGYPLFVKPVRAGSSYGVTQVMREGELEEAVKLAFAYDERIILEEAIDGFEVGCAVMGNSSLIVGEPDEVELSQGFFDFTEKYTLKTSAIHVPARVSSTKSAEIKRAALRIYQSLGCRGFARVDMFLTPDGEVVFNEVNTIPGFTEHSRFPAMLAAAGMDFEQVVTTAIELAVEP